jgi:hypothetical protein
VFRRIISRMKRIKSQSRHRTYAALVAASAILISTRHPCKASTSRRLLGRERDNPLMSEPRSAADSSDSCTTLLHFRYDCSNDLLTDYDHDNRILTVRDYTHYVNKLAHQNVSSSASTSTQSVAYGNQSSWSSDGAEEENFRQINERFQMLYIEHLCEAYFSRGTLPQFRQRRFRRNTRHPSNSNSYSSLQECYLDLLQHSIDNSTIIFGYPSDDVTIQDVNNLCQDLFHLTITMGYVSSCDPECVTRDDFLPLCSNKLSLYAGPNQVVTSEDYTELIQLLLQSMPSSSSSLSYNMSFQQLDNTLQQNFIRHICTYQQQGATDECLADYTISSADAQIIGYPNYAASSQDIANLCSDLFQLVSCLNYVTPCDGQINITEKCTGMIFF